MDSGAVDEDDAHPQAPSAATLGGKTLGSILCILRLQKGWSQREAIVRAEEHATAPGLAVSALSHYENGRRVPSPSHLVALVRSLDPQGTAFLELLEAAAQADPHYHAATVLVRGGQWARAEWEGWAAAFPARMPRKGRNRGE